MQNNNVGLRQPNGSVAEDVLLLSVAAQLNVNPRHVMYLRPGYTIDSARFIYDEILHRIWRIPFHTPTDTIIESVIDGKLNGSIELEPSDLLVTNYHYIWGKEMSEGVMVRTPKDLVWCSADGCWYRYCADASKLPVQTYEKSPLEMGIVKSPTTPEDKAVWENMGATGIGANYKGEPGEDGVYVEYIKQTSESFPAVGNERGYTNVTVTTKLSNEKAKSYSYTVYDGYKGDTGASVYDVDVDSEHTSATNDAVGKTDTTITISVENAEPAKHTFAVLDGVNLVSVESSSKQTPSEGVTVVGKTDVTLTTKLTGQEPVKHDFSVPHGQPGISITAVKITVERKTAVFTPDF